MSTKSTKEFLPRPRRGSTEAPVRIGKGFVQEPPCFFPGPAGGPLKLAGAAGRRARAGVSSPAPPGVH